jgi:PAS domain S-box-containing protein
VPDVPTTLRLLIVEDSEDDAQLIVRDLKRGGFEPDFTRVDSAAAFRAAVDRGTWDIIISDFNMPQFTGTDALKLLRATDQETPFIFVSGTIGEDVAVEAMRAGAQDYVVKGNLKRLAPAIERELADAAARRERRASEERYRLLFERHPNPLWLFDRETLRFLDVNEAAVRHYGYSRQEFLAMTIEAIRPRDDVPALRDRLQLGQPGLHTPTVWRHLKKDGTIIDVEITSHDVDLHGRRTRLVSAIDVTARRRAEDALMARERQQAAVALLGQRAIEASDLTSLMTAAASLVSETLDVPYADVLERTPNGGHSLLLRAGVGWRGGYVGHAKVEMGPDSEAGYTLEHNEPIIVRDLRTETRFHGAAILHDHGIVSGITVVIPGQQRPFGVLGAHADRPREFTHDDLHFLQAVAHILGTAVDRDRAETTLRQSQRLESVGRLAGGVAHDFNNVLTAIFGYADLLAEELPADSPGREDLLEIRTAAERAAGLTRQLLAFSRQQVLQPVVLNMNDVVENLQKMLTRLIGADVVLQARLSPDLRNIRADAGQLEQVIVNLIVNARDAMPGGGKLTIETANAELGEAYADAHRPVVPGRYVMLAVSDTGTGMDAVTKARLFEPFFTTKTAGKGTGLGLATVYGIVKQSGGYIWVYSELDHGTTFKVYLPQVEAPAEAVREPATTTGTPVGTETVLLAEDDALLRPLTRELLVKLGYRVLEASDSAAALAAARAHPGEIHLLISDVVMPGESGVQLARQIMADRPRLRVLYVSGYTDEAVVGHGLLAAGVDFLQKPFTPAGLARKVRQVLDTS